MALNIPYLFNEIKSLEDRGVPTPKILVSDRAQILMPYHVDLIHTKKNVLAVKHLVPLSPVLHHLLRQVC